MFVVNPLPAEPPRKTFCMIHIFPTESWVHLNPALAGFVVCGKGNILCVHTFSKGLYCIFFMKKGWEGFVVFLAINETFSPDPTPPSKKTELIVPCGVGKSAKNGVIILNRGIFCISVEFTIIQKRANILKEYL